MSPNTLEQSVQTANAALDDSFPSRFAVVHVDEIYIDRFQRPLEERWLKARQGKLSKAKLQTVILSERDRHGKKYSAVDGQHRIELVRRETDTDPRFGEQDKYVAALVFYDLTVEQEAQLFADFQRERRAITPYQRFNAELIAGSEQAKAIDKIVREEGYTLGDVESGETRTIKAIVALEKIYEDDPALLRTVLRLTSKTWNGLPYAQNERMLRALWYFLQEVGGDLNEERFVERLSAVTPTALVTRAHNLREFKGMNGALPRFLAEAIHDQYRSKRAVRR